MVLTKDVRKCLLSVGTFAHPTVIYNHQIKISKIKMKLEGTKIDLKIF